MRHSGICTPPFISHGACMVQTKCRALTALAKKALQLNSSYNNTKLRLTRKEPVQEVWSKSNRFLKLHIKCTFAVPQPNVTSELKYWAKLTFVLWAQLLPADNSSTLCIQQKSQYCKLGLAKPNKRPIQGPARFVSTSCYVMSCFMCGFSALQAGFSRLRMTVQQCCLLWQTFAGQCVTASSNQFFRFENFTEIPPSHFHYTRSFSKAE